MKHHGLSSAYFYGLILLGLGWFLGGCGSSNSPSTPASSGSSEPNYSTTAVTVVAGTSLFGPFGIGYSPSNGNLWFANAIEEYLDEYTTAGASVTYISTFNGSTSFNQLSDVKVGPDGTVYASDYNVGVYVFSPGGTYQTSITGLTTVESAATNSAGTTLYVVEASPKAILFYLINSSTSPKTFTFEGMFGSTSSGVGALSSPGFMALDSNNHVFVANYGLGNIIRYNSDGTGPVSFGSDLLTKPLGIAVDGAGNVLVSQNANPGFIQEFNPSGNSYTAGVILGSASYLDYPSGLTLDGSGNLYVSNSLYQILEFKKTN